MQTVSDNYNTIIAGDHRFETLIRFHTPSGNKIVYEGGIISVSRTQALFSENRPMVGCACVGECELTIYKPSFIIPRMGSFDLRIRAKSETATSGWFSQGTFFVDTREKGNLGQDETLTIHAYDAMAKAAQNYPAVSHAWPANVWRVVRDIATAMGVSIDPRTRDILEGETAAVIPLPSGYSCSEILKAIGTMYMANWYMTSDGNLRMVGLNDLPREARYLVDENGNRITFGGTRILV